MEGRYSIADAVWDSTGRGHRGREGEDTCISKFVVCLQWRNLPFSALHTLIMTCSTISKPEWPEREEFDSLHNCNHLSTFIGGDFPQHHVF